MPRRIVSPKSLRRLQEHRPAGQVEEGVFVERRTVLWLPMALLGLTACRRDAPVTPPSTEASPPTPSTPPAPPADATTTTASSPPPLLRPLGFEAFVARWRALTTELDDGARSQDAYLYALSALAARVDAMPPTEMLSSKTLGPSVEFGETYREAPIVATQWRLKRGAALPPHNHPPFCGVTLGLEGTCRIRTYRLLPEGSSPTSPDRALRVACISDEQCAPGRVVSRVSLDANVHETRPVPRDARGVDLYVTVGDRRDFSGLTIEPTPIDPDQRIFDAQWDR